MNDGFKEIGKWAKDKREGKITAKVSITTLWFSSNGKLSSKQVKEINSDGTSVSTFYDVDGNVTDAFYRWGSGTGDAKRIYGSAGNSSGLKGEESNIGAGNLETESNSSQSNGGIDAVSVALGVGELAFQGKVYNIYGYSAEQIENLLKKGKYLHNGEVYYKGNYKGVTSSMKSSFSAAKLVKNIGKGFAAVGAIIAVVDFYNSDRSGGDYAKLTGAGIITTLSFIPRVGTAASIGLGILDGLGKFDNIYKSFDK